MNFTVKRVVFLVISEKAYAKINLALDVLGKRPDGFHEVKMVMQSIELADEVEFSEHEELLVETIGAQLASDDSNLAFRAARLFGREAGVEPHVKIKIEKKIPLGAGLAGGSSDAAAVLRGLNRFYAAGLTDKQLESLSAQIGSDVAFCIAGGTALATGRGELVTQVKPAPECFVVLANPGFEVSTAWVYKNFSGDLVKRDKNVDKVLQAIAQGNLEVLAQNVFNVLEGVTIKAHPVIDEIKSVMLRSGALVSLMSGSGPSVFALAADERAAARVAQAVREQTSANVWVSEIGGVK